MPGVVVGFLVSQAVTGFVAANLLTATVGGSLLSFGAIKFISTAVGALAGGLATSVIGRAIYGRPQDPGQAVRAPTERTLTVKQPISYWQRIYGEIRVGGILTYWESDSANHLHHLVITFASHPVEEIGDIWFNDEVLHLDASGNAVGKYADHVRVSRSLGQEAFGTQPFPNLVAESAGKWTSSHRQDGHAKIYVRIKWNPDLFPTGLPNIAAVIRGKRLFDPRTGTVRWSPNAALVVADYLADIDVGLGATGVNEIDNAQLIATANICDERVALATVTTTFEADPASDVLTLAADSKIPSPGDGVRVSVDGGGSLPAPLVAGTTYFVITAPRGGIRLATTYANSLAGVAIDITSAGTGTRILTYHDENRFELHGAFTVQETPYTILGVLLTAMLGEVRFIGGQWRIQASSYIVPTVELSEDDLRGPIRIMPRLSKPDLCNGVKGVHFNANNLWQPSDYPPVTNAMYLAEDQGERLWREQSLPFTRSASAAQRIARIILERTRQQIAVEVSCKLRAYQLLPGDTVMLTLARYGWVQKVFDVVDVSLIVEEGQLGVDLVLRETAAAVYDWNSGMETRVDPAPDTNLPNPFVAGVPGNPLVREELYVTRDGRGVGVRAIVTWAAPADQFVLEYQPEYKLATASTYTVLGLQTSTRVDIDDIDPGVYDFRVLAINSIGVRSVYSGVTRREIIGLAASPALPVIRGLQAAGGLAILTLDPHPDLDVRRGGRWLVRHSEAMTGAHWQSSFSIGEERGYVGDQTTLVLPLKAGSYLVRAEDSTGQQSVGEAVISTKQASILPFSTVATLAEEPSFLGTHVSTVGADNILKFAGVGLFDSIANFDLVSDLDSHGGIATSGMYTFSTGFDFGSVVRRRLTGQIDGFMVNVLDKLDDRTNNIDSWLDFDGVTAGSSVDAILEFRQTDDDPAGSPAWSTWRRLDASEVQCRAAQFRLRLVSNDPANNIHINQLQVHAASI